MTALTTLGNPLRANEAGPTSPPPSSPPPAILSVPRTPEPLAAPTAAPAGEKPRPSLVLPTPVVPTPTPALSPSNPSRCSRLAEDEKQAEKAPGPELVRLLTAHVASRARLEDERNAGGLDEMARECLEGTERILSRLVARLGPEEHAKAAVQAELGEYYLLSGRKAEALEALGRAAQAPTPALRTLGLRARAARENGNAGIELESLRAVLRQVPAAGEDARLWIQSFREIRSRETPRALLEALSLYRNRFPSSRELLLEEGELALQIEDPARLESVSRRLASSQSDDAHRAAAAYLEARALVLRNRDVAALESFRSFLTRSRGLPPTRKLPNDWERTSYRELARLHLKTANLLVALTASLEGLRNFPEDAELTARLEEILNQLRRARRLPPASQIAAALAAAPGSTSLRRLWSRTLLAEGQLESAEAQAKTLTDADASDAEAWSLRGQASRRRRRFLPAQGFFNEALHRLAFRSEPPRIPANFPLRELVVEAALNEAARGDRGQAREILRRGLQLCDAKEDKLAIQAALKRLDGSSGRP